MWHASFDLTSARPRSRVWRCFLGQSSATPRLVVKQVPGSVAVVTHTTCTRATVVECRGVGPRSHDAACPGMVAPLFDSQVHSLRLLRAGF